MLDTHTLLWAIGKSNELSAQVTEQITDSKNEVYVSAVSLWEISLKYSLGKLTLGFEIENIPEYCRQMGFYLISLEPQEALGSFKLPQKKDHKDPFDRMLIYQCIKNNYILISKDSKIKSYNVDGLNYMWQKIGDL
jgi:PIN domain nuclease of toxin-antitoxin system